MRRRSRARQRHRHRGRRCCRACSTCSRRATARSTAPRAGSASGSRSRAAWSNCIAARLRFAAMVRIWDRSSPSGAGHHRVGRPRASTVGGATQCCGGLSRPGGRRQRGLGQHHGHAVDDGRPPLEGRVGRPDRARAGADFRPHVVLLDIGLPEMNGYEVARRLQEMPELHNTVLVAMTGYGQEEDRRRSRSAGFAHHLVKPVDPAVLQRVIASGPCES